MVRSTSEISTLKESETLLNDTKTALKLRGVKYCFLNDKQIINFVDGRIRAQIFQIVKFVHKFSTVRISGMLVAEV